METTTVEGNYSLAHHSHEFRAAAQVLTFVARGGTCFYHGVQHKLVTYMISECLRQASVSPYFTPKKLTFQSLYRIQAKSKKAKSLQHQEGRSRSEPAKPPGEGGDYSLCMTSIGHLGLHGSFHRYKQQLLSVLERL
ncbi:hypothetical protein HZ326_31514 [Fusarium oxysporum f. sp. albedinis]|nr:hypothetical protein HZ326_31514 [Fusarium oxysporum f. sp. albedinis]